MNEPYEHPKSECFLFILHIGYNVSVFFRDAASHDNGIEQPAQSLDHFRNSNNVGKRNKETLTTDDADVTTDAVSEPVENGKCNSTADHSLHDHSYSCKKQVRKRKRNRPRVTGNDQSSNSDLSRKNSELAENHSAPDDEHKSNVVKMKNKKLSVDKAVCELCGWICDKSVSLEVHVRTHAVMKSMECGKSVSLGTKTESHKCDLCGMVFEVQQEFCKHVTDVHAKSASGSPGVNLSTLTISDVNKSQNIKQGENKKCESDILAVCDLCGWMRTEQNRRRSLKQHMMLKHSNERPFKCAQCSQAFKMKHVLQRHENIHNDVREFLCQYCAKSFQRNETLVCHIRRHHADMLDSDAKGQKAFCQQCDKVFSCKAKLRKHTCTRVRASRRTRPAATRAFGCNVCGVDFVFALRLERHIIGHGTGITGPAYKCQLCSEQCETMTALESHVLEVHSIAGPKYQCTDCNRLFRIESQLKQHMRIHTANAITCTVCGKKFVFQSTLKIHMVTHTGSSRQTAEKLFQCSVCGKRFVDRGQLNSHERIHSGAKPFVCNVCGRAFRYRQHLRRHGRTHTDARPYCCSFCSKTYRHRLDLQLHCRRVHNVELPVKGRDITAAACM